MPRHYYAAQSSRGFANEINVHRFESRELRDSWVAEHRNDGDVDSATIGAYAITADQAREIMARRNDDATKQYNAMFQISNGEWLPRLKFRL